MGNREIIYDHYKDSFLLQRENEKIRNKLFIEIIVTIAVLMMLTLFPNNFINYFQQLILSIYEVDITIEINILEILIWFILVYFTIKYFQINSNIEKNYKYIYQLEETLNKKYKLAISREGKNYLNVYPQFLDYTYKFYKYIFPMLYIVILIYKNILNVLNNGIFDFMSIVVLLVTILLIKLNISYINFNKKISEKEEKNG